MSLTTQNPSLHDSSGTESRCYLPTNQISKCIPWQKCDSVRSVVYANHFKGLHSSVNELYIKVFQTCPEGPVICFHSNFFLNSKFSFFFKNHICCPDLVLSSEPVTTTTSESTIQGSFPIFTTQTPILSGGTEFQCELPSNKIRECVYWKNCKSIFDEFEEKKRQRQDISVILSILKVYQICPEGEVMALSFNILLFSKFSSLN